MSTTLANENGGRAGPRVAYKEPYFLQHKKGERNLGCEEGRGGKGLRGNEGNGGNEENEENEENKKRENGGN